jgi:hypothetical protein
VARHYTLAINFLARLLVNNNQADTGRRRYGPTVLVSKTAHSCALWLLLTNQPVGDPSQLAAQGL